MIHFPHTETSHILKGFKVEEDAENWFNMGGFLMMRKAGINLTNSFALSNLRGLQFSKHH